MTVDDDPAPTIEEGIFGPTYQRNNTTEPLSYKPPVLGTIQDSSQGTTTGTIEC